MKGNFLTDNYTIVGSDYEEFKDKLAEISKTIRYKVVNSADVSLLSHRGTDTTDVDRFFKLSASNIDVFDNLICKVLEENKINLPGYYTKNADSIFAKSNVCLQKEALLKKGDFEDVLNEMRTDNHLMIEVNGEPMFTSKSLLTTLDRFGLKGSFLVRPSLTRDMAVMAEFVEQEKPITLIYRKAEGGIKKVFSILSDKYQPIDQNVIIDIIDDITDDGSLGNPVCKEWEINHFFTKIYLDFPEKARDIKNHYGKTEKFIPGICIMSSDTGDCSLKVLGTFRVGNSLTVQDEVLHKHIGDVDVESIIKAVDERIFSEYAKLPDKLCNLMLVDIGDPTADLTDEENQKANIQAYKEVVTNAFKELGILKAVGVKARNILLEKMIYEAAEDTHYTAYDVCVELMRLPQRVSGLASLPQLQKAVGRAPYITYLEEKPITVAP